MVLCNTFIHKIFFTWNVKWSGYNLIFYHNHCNIPTPNDTRLCQLCIYFIYQSIDNFYVFELWSIIINRIHKTYTIFIKNSITPSIKFIWKRDMPWFHSLIFKKSVLIKKHKIKNTFLCLIYPFSLYPITFEKKIFRRKYINNCTIQYRINCDKRTTFLWKLFWYFTQMPQIKEIINYVKYQDNLMSTSYF